MADNSKIEWTDSTFNPWVGCQKVSQGCAPCYAETLIDGRFGRDAWGPGGTRQRTSDANWRKTWQWNSETWQCAKCGEWHKPKAEWAADNCLALCPKCETGIVGPRRRRVFCASLADVFEVKDDQQEEMERWRLELFDLIRQTPNLDWLLLTKRPQSVRYCVGRAFNQAAAGKSMKELDAEPRDSLFHWLGYWFHSPGLREDGYSKAPANVWLGTSVEGDMPRGTNPIYRVDILRDAPARVRFLSCEPLIAPVGSINLKGIDWVICGGESGSEARPMHPDWARELRDQCQDAGVPFLFKQWGEWAPGDTTPLERSRADVTAMYREGHCHAWGPDLISLKTGKRAAGRLLDGRTWDEYPDPEVKRA